MTLLAALLPLGVADDISPTRNLNLTSVESLCVTLSLLDDRLFLSTLEERRELVQEFTATLAEDAVLYDLPPVGLCSVPFDQGEAEVRLSVLVLDSDNGLRYDLSVLFHGLRSHLGPLFEATIYSRGGVTVFNRAPTQDELGEMMLDAASDLFRTFALDWKEVH